jgi:hypothetical protein
MRTLSCGTKGLQLGSLHFSLGINAGPVRGIWELEAEEVA